MSGLGIWGYIVCAFSAGVVGISLSAVITVLAIPVKMAYYANSKRFIRFAPWICMAGAVFSSFGFFAGGFTFGLPLWGGVAVLFLMGAMLGMSAVSLAEMMDVFTGPFNFVRISEFKWIVFSIALGKGAFSLVQLVGGIFR